MSRRVIFLLAIALAAILCSSLEAQAPASLSGTVTDATGAFLPGVDLTLEHTQTRVRYELESSGTGVFEFTSIPPGTYSLSAALPGFRTLTQTVTLAGLSVSRVLTLAVGELTETIHVQRDLGATAGSGSPAAPAGRAPGVVQQVADGCRAVQAQSATPSIGGMIRPPRQIRRVNPAYPAGAANAGIGGVILLNAVIGADGLVRDVDNISPSAHPDLVASAIDAVRGWEYDGTLLNCTPVAVTMHVIVNFEVR